MIVKLAIYKENFDLTLSYPVVTTRTFRPKFDITAGHTCTPCDFINFRPNSIKLLDLPLVILSILGPNSIKLLDLPLVILSILGPNLIKMLDLPLVILSILGPNLIKVLDLTLIIFFIFYAQIGQNCWTYPFWFFKF